MAQTSAESLELAMKHLERVHLAWDEPTDWTDLSTYGFYCLEACVVAAALHLGRPRPNSHPAKVEQARSLAKSHGLPDIDNLLLDLNTMRKFTAYGDTEPPEDLDAEDVSATIEEYLQAVRALLE